MGHELLDYDSMVSAGGRKPWHLHLGTPVNMVDGDLVVTEAPAASGLDWMTEHRPTFYPRVVGINDDGSEAVEYVEIEDARAVVRIDNDRYLGTVGSQHALVQNEALFDLAAAIQAEAEGQVLIETAGSLKGNRLVWVLARLDRDLSVDGDQHVPYLLIANSHDGTMSLRVQTTPVRVVCWNTLSWAIAGQKQAWVARHSEGIGGKVDEIKRALRLSWAYLDRWEADVRRMMDTPVPSFRFDKFTERLIPLEVNPTDRMVANVNARREEVRSIYEGGTVAPYTGTAWGAFNAGTEWAQWKRPVHGSTRAERLGGRAVGGDLSAEATRIRSLLVQSVPALAGA